MKKLSALYLFISITASLWLFGCGGSGSGGGGKSCEPSTPGGSGNPEIRFKNVPAKGSTDKVRGATVHVKTDTHQVALYIRVGDGWWTKPTWDNPGTPINNCDGSWETVYATGGSDAQANQFAAFLVPKSYGIPLAKGESSIPGNIENTALAKAFASR